MKKFLALLFCIVMVLGLLAACQQTPAETNPLAETNKPAESNKPAETTAPAEEPVKLRLVLYGDNSTRKDEFFKNEFHDKVLKELNIDFTMEWLPWSEMNGSVITNMLASGESFAFENIISLNDFHTKGYLAPVSMDDIAANMPAYLEMREEGGSGFDCAVWKDDIYCIPIGAKAYAGAHQSITVRTDLLEEAGVDWATIKTIDDLHAAIDAVKAIHPEITVMRNSSSLVLSLASSLVPGWACAEKIDPFCFVNELENTDTVYSYYESELYKNFVYLMQEWVKKGYKTEEEFTNAGKTEADWTAGAALMMYGTPGNLVETNIKAAFPDVDLKNIKIGDQPYIKTRDYDWAISFSTNEKDNIPHWLRLINWIYESEENYNFCIYGVEGKDYEVQADGTIKKLVEDTFWDDWFLQASKYVRFDASISQENIDAYMVNDVGSIVSKQSGFTFDKTPVEIEAALLNAVVTEQLAPLSAGFGDYDKDFPAIQKALKEAGIDKYVAEYQRQFSEWKAAQ